MGFIRGHSWSGEGDSHVVVVVVAMGFIVRLLRAVHVVKQPAGEPRVVQRDRPAARCR